MPIGFYKNVFCVKKRQMLFYFPVDIEIVVSIVQEKYFLKGIYFALFVERGSLRSEVYRTRRRIGYRGKWFIEVKNIKNQYFAQG